MVLPTLYPRPDAPRDGAPGEYVGGTKIYRHRAVRVERSIEELIDEAIATDTIAREIRSSFEAYSQASATKPIDMAHLLERGEADLLEYQLRENPLMFQRALDTMAQTRPNALMELVMLRLLARATRASHGAKMPFPKLHQHVYGRPFDLAQLGEHIHQLFTSDAAKSMRPAFTAPGTPFAQEFTAAFYELVFAALAPLYYASDVLLFSASREPVFAIPSRRDTRYLSTSTILGVAGLRTPMAQAVRMLALKLVDTALATSARHRDEARARGDASDDEDTDGTQSGLLVQLRLTMFSLEEASATNALLLSPTEQVMVDPTTKALVLGDLTDCWPVAASLVLGGAGRVAITTSNVNGFKETDAGPAQQLAKQLQQCTFFQESKFGTRDHYNKFHGFVTNHVGHQRFKLFINDARSLMDHSTAPRSLGVVTFFHDSMPGFDQLEELRPHRVDNRYHVIRTSWGTTPVFFHNVYAPVEANERPAFFAGLPRDFNDDCLGLHFVGGDFNIPVDARLDASSALLPNHNIGKVEMLEWLSALRTVDAWRFLHPHRRDKSGPKEINRLDYMYVDHELTMRHLHTATYGHMSEYSGDHRPLHIELMPEPTLVPLTSRRIWRLPRELLEDPKTVRAIQVEATRLLDELVRDPDCNAGAKWCGWLRRIKSQLRHGLHNRQQHRRLVLEALRHTHITTKIAASRGQATNEQVEAAKHALNEAEAETRQVNRDGGFDRQSNLNERASSMFLRKSPAIKTAIASATRDGITTTDPQQVADIFTSHWSTIMRNPPDAVPPDLAHQEYVINHVSASLSDEQQATLDRPFEEEELCSAIRTMKKNKSPGPDGWSAAFFQVAPITFAAILVRVFNYQRSAHGILLEHQRRSSITLLYKKGDRSLPGNYRPIALMSVEVKILSRTMARRLAMVASTLIHPSQAGFVQGRAMTDHIHLIHALQHKATIEQETWVATFLDYAKAYDMVQQGFMLKVMEKMRIGPEFLRWVKLLYKAPEVRLLLNGSLGPVIRPTRGVKQGCPLSCLLFDLYLEPLGAMLRARPELGIPLANDRWLTGVFFADDSTILSATLQSAEVQLAEIVAPFCAASGAALNQDKCITLALDSSTPVESLERLPSLTLAEHMAPIRFLGAYVGHGLDYHHQAQLISDKFLSSFAQWQWRARTIKGRRTLASALLLGLVWHVTAFTPISDAILERWQKMLNHYVTGNKTTPDEEYRPPIAQAWFHDRQVGLGIPHIASVLRGQRLRALQRLMTESAKAPQPAWTELVLEQFAQCLPSTFRPSHPFDFLSYTPETGSKWVALTTLHPFWRDVWSAWAPVSMKHKMPLTPDLATTLSMPLWLTRYAEFYSDDELMPASVVSGRREAAAWARHGASNSLWCLRDFLMNTGTPGCWPSWDEFRNAMSMGNRALGVVYNARRDAIEWPLVHYTRNLYKHLTKVYWAVLGRTGHRHDAVLPAVAVAPHPFRAIIKDAVVPLEYWPRRLINKLAAHADIPTIPPLMHGPTRPDRAAAGVYMRLFRHSMDLLTPVHADVWFRATMKMLPVAARYNFPNARNPVTCPHDCDSLETAAHALRDCPKLAPAWAEHQRAWDHVGVGLSWSDAMNIDQFKVNYRGTMYKQALFRLWFMLVGVMLHLGWSRRNHKKHRQRAVPDTRVMADISFVTWMTTVRSWLRLQQADDLDAIATRAALAMLFRQAPYDALRAKHPRCLQLDTTFDVH